MSRRKHRSQSNCNVSIPQFHTTLQISSCCIKTIYRILSFSFFMARWSTIRYCMGYYPVFCSFITPIEYKGRSTEDIARLNAVQYSTLLHTASLWLILNLDLGQPHGPLTRYTKLLLVHAPGIPGTFPLYRGLAIPTSNTARAWSTCRDACRDH